MKRGHETPQHIQMKLIIAKILEKRSFITFFERKNCDVIAVRGRITLGAECQTSCKHTLENARRDFEILGCSHVLFICITQAVAKGVRAEINKFLPAHMRRKTSVAVIKI